MIRYAICLSTMAFEEDAAAAVSWEHEVSLSGRLERARFASQMASLNHHWEKSRGHLRRQHMHSTQVELGLLQHRRGRGRLPGAGHEEEEAAEASLERYQ